MFSAWRARGIVPASVLERKDKMGFPVPLARWAAGPLREPLIARLRDGPLVDAGGHGRHLWFFLILSEWMSGAGISM